MDEIDEVLDSLGAMFIWDNVEKRGFPLTKDVKILDIEELSWEEKQILGSGNELEISALAEKYGEELSSFIMMGATVFVKLMQAVYESESIEKKKEIAALIRNTIRDIADRWGDDSE